MAKAKKVVKANWSVWNLQVREQLYNYLIQMGLRRSVAYMLAQRPRARAWTPESSDTEFRGTDIEFPAILAEAPAIIDLMAREAADSATSGLKVTDETIAKWEATYQQVKNDLTQEIG